MRAESQARGEKHAQSWVQKWTAEAGPGALGHASPVCLAPAHRESILHHLLALWKPSAILFTWVSWSALSPL